jgi:perosamine synthetase
MFKIPQMEPLFGEEEVLAVSSYMRSGGFFTEFKQTEIFEDLIKSFTGSKYCIVTNNGTISLTLGAMAAGIGPEDEVIVPNYTMIATPNSVRMLGAKPVFVDIEPNTLCLDIEKVKEVIGRRTKALILVDANGRYPTCGIQPFEELARQHNLILIEDAAQGLGSFFPDGRHVGRAGLFGSFSFSTPKIISTGQGGAIITDSKDLDTAVRKLKDFGRVSGGTDVHDSIGFNFKFTDIQACIGIEQMKKLPGRIIRKKEIWDLYSNELSKLAHLQVISNDLRHTTPWFIEVLTDQRNALKEYLAKFGIGSRVMYPPINKQQAYNDHREFPVSNDIGRRGLWLPSSNQLKNDEIYLICSKIKEYFS